MAVQINISISGKVGNIIYFKRYGKDFARSMPLHVRQTPATKPRSGNFGLASSSAKSLRQQLAAVLPDAKDRSMQLRFTGAIVNWLATSQAATLQAIHPAPYVSNFQFNSATTIAERWKLAITVESPGPDILGLHIPAFIPIQCMAAPAHTSSITCTIAAAGSLLNNSTATGQHTVTMEIPYNNVLIPAQVIALPVGMPAGALVVTAIRLQYKLTSGKYYELPAFLPASVVDARYC